MSGYTNSFTTHCPRHRSIPRRTIRRAESREKHKRHHNYQSQSNFFPKPFLFCDAPRSIVQRSLEPVDYLAHRRSRQTLPFEFGYIDRESSTTKGLRGICARDIPSHEYGAIFGYVAVAARAALASWLSLRLDFFRSRFRRDRSATSS